MSNETGGQAVRRSGGQSARALLLSLTVLTAWPTDRLLSQVGYDPQASPYRDITTTQGVSVLFGRFGGARAQTGVGARPGAFAALRLDTRLSGPLDLSLTVGQAYSSRLQIFPDDTLQRYHGPIDQTLLAVDAALMLNLTGRKSWHRLAPYFGIGFGLVQPVKGGVTDPGGFRVGSNFVMAPTLGTNVHVSRSLVLRAEVRDYWLRYEWPLAYFVPADSTHPAVLPEDHSTRQITHNVTLSVGLSYRFTF